MGKGIDTEEPGTTAAFRHPAPARAADIAPSPAERRPLAALTLILLIGLALRVALLATPRSYHADEIFQYLEQAHRLVFGYGIVPWEYRYGIRSMLLPIVLSWPMAWGEWLQPGTTAYLIVPRLCLCLISLGNVIAAYLLGRRISARHGLFAAMVIALWPEFVLFGGQALTDTIAVPFALIGAVLLQAPRSSRSLILSGALLALAATIRFPYTPALVSLVVVSLRLRWREWGWLGLGAVAALVCAAIPELAIGRLPYAWVWENLHQNVGAGRATAYGVSGPFFYLLRLVKSWAIWLVPLGWLAWLGGRRYPAVLTMAIVNIVVHSLLSHKEYRFILVSMVTLVILAAIGTVDVHDRYRSRLAGPALLAGWLLAALTFLALPEQRDAWAREVPGNRAFMAIGRDPRTCGVALWETWWTHAGGYTYLHRRVPLYLPERTDQSRQALFLRQSAFNVILAPDRPLSPLPPAFRRSACFGPADSGRPLCTWSRAGGCDGRGAQDLLIDHFVGEPDKSAN